MLRHGSGIDERWVFDYRYTVRSGKQSRTYRQTVIAFPYLDVNLPAFELRPEHFFHKLGALFGFQDIDLPAHPDFSSRRLLRGREVTDIRHLIDGELVEILRDPSICIEGDGSCLLFYRSRRTIPADRILPAIEEASHLCAAVRQRALDLGWTAQDVPQETALV